MLDVDIEIAAGDWPEFDWPARAAEAAEAAIRATPYGYLVDDDMACELAVRFTDDVEVRKLNRQYRGKDRPTNVLSFPAVQRDLLAGLTNTDDGEVLLGDIALAAETCAREAADKRISLIDHATHLIVHGTLHIVGYDHELEAEAIDMEQLETTILARFGIADPYQDRVDG
ncbi:rRNA maturation RNase YbeY [Pacificimonas sp. WHA3]|uniref:Endoribonuclease YbeY n=1 Tax=Pacificimonas pallii TaxID=2827236 RepID=A0ABS6SCZ8_9SPHN|nr:rRNA maturation RNase YbeY [Pacificimonas pallii]MBV7256295.1 rRNA maturation RNase YbeY [Pacificimonas pallii]